MKRVLIVDDNLVNLKQAQALLMNKYDVILAKSGESALQICGREKPDMILLDVEMPGMDGFATIKTLKEDQTLSHIPVIFLTASRSTEVEVKALESGAVDFVTKPIDKEILLHRLELHLNLAAYQSSLETSVRELEDNIVISFTELVDCKEDNTGQHLLRTGSYVRLLGDELVARGMFTDELSPEKLDMIVRAAPFHDIGKLGVSDMLLLKPGALTAAEYAEVQKHTTIGATLLKTIYRRVPSQHYLGYASIIAEAHHERYDGNGYPNRIGGDDIPLCCRIVAIANVYDACLTDRVYRKAMDYEGAFRVIMDERGGLFDPKLVDVFAESAGKFAALDEKLRLAQRGD